MESGFNFPGRLSEVFCLGEERRQLCRMMRRPLVMFAVCWVLELLQQALPAAVLCLQAERLLPLCWLYGYGGE